MGAYSFLHKQLGRILGVELKGKVGYTLRTTDYRAPSTPRNKATALQGKINRNTDLLDLLSVRLK